MTLRDMKSILASAPDNILDLELRVAETGFAGDVSPNRLIFCGDHIFMDFGSWRVSSLGEAEGRYVLVCDGVTRWERSALEGGG